MQAQVHVHTHTLTHTHTHTRTCMYSSHMIMYVICIKQTNQIKQHTHTYTHIAVKGNENQHSAVEISQDHKAWKEYSISKSNYLVQPSIVRPTPNKSYLVAFFRDRRAVYIYTSTSTDEGG